MSMDNLPLLQAMGTCRWYTARRKRYGEIIGKNEWAS